MGPSRKDLRLTQDEVKALLREKDDQIASLESRLEAYSARASTAHIRLLKTIDVLDALRAQHALETSTEEQAKMRLAHEVDRWRSIAKSLEVERDELKDVVEDLIEKVQISNEWSSWPCSRMRITKHAEQVTGGTSDVGPIKDKCNDDLITYATSIVARLRTELDFERQGHNKTAEEANLRIEELEAQVAVREAELEACLNSPNHKQDPSTGAPHALGKWKPCRKVCQPDPLSDEECLRFLESNNARNRSLELEIRQIAERLEQARVAPPILSEPCKGSPRDSQSLVLETGHNNATNPSGAASIGLTTPTAGPGVTRQPASEDSLPPDSPPIMLSIARLDNRIRCMTSQTDALKAERATLVEIAARQRRASSLEPLPPVLSAHYAQTTTNMTMDNLSDVLRIEEECIRLSAQVNDLQAQLDHTHASAQTRERELMFEIEQRFAQTAQRPYHVYGSHPLEEDIADDSMELATPLQPTITLSAQSPVVTTSQPSDPHLVPLPFSPERVSSPVASRSPIQQGIQRMHEALEAARTHLAAKEALLVQLRVDMETLRRQVEVQPVDEGEESQPESLTR
ncbi:hypothetical protein PAXRUDRAFT_149414 [Paxillus rubicundulus Ve08.2h10]|uniref:Uncharacterized protein n=1 Tax=Paxillus rubicundulus Ve08.2h10 TaxID=930991 RepID=A0A0D0DY77_9AGAM|nr:hypothetical protein PAXRUDRAFT_149414 [Paxillus rubicundulus Ve08.2h10]